MHLANSPTEIECGKCHRTLAIDEFYLNAKTYARKRAGKVIGQRFAPRGNRASYCKDCKRAYDRAHRAKQDPAVKKQRQIDAYLRDRESLSRSFWGGCTRARKAGAGVYLSIGEWRA